MLEKCRTESYSSEISDNERTYYELRVEEVTVSKRGMQAPEDEYLL